jgi:hypothetical protein
MHGFWSSQVRRANPAPSNSDLPVDPRAQATLPVRVRKQCPPFTESVSRESEVGKFSPTFDITD